ncbi:RidA family protein [Variovorax sp. GB1P17]|uniref:RidA family protein n=1 Tax=Variovorax sp. GB1P17 TaxID=3443740 RepID=UPI003F454999
MTATLATRIVLPDVPPPGGPYSHGIAVSGPGTWLHIAGQVGMALDGSVPNDFEAQAQLAWTHLVAVLRAADMDVSHLVKVTTFLTDGSDVRRLGSVRAMFLGEARPASTLLVVRALAHPAWRVEVEASAFRPG